VLFRSIEVDVISEIGAGNPEGAKAILEKSGMLKYRDGKRLRNRERAELEAKLEIMNLQIPWK